MLEYVRIIGTCEVKLACDCKLKILYDREEDNTLLNSVNVDTEIEKFEPCDDHKKIPRYLIDEEQIVHDIMEHNNIDILNLLDQDEIQYLDFTLDDYIDKLEYERYLKEEAA